MRIPRLSRRRLVLICGVGTAGLVVLIASCDATSSHKSSTGIPASTGSTDSTGSAGSDGLRLDGTPNTVGRAAGKPAPAAPSAAAVSAPASQAAGAAGAPPPLLTGRDIVRIADITVRTADIKKAVAGVERVAKFEGGSVFTEQENLMPKDSDTSGNASATLTIRVPPDNLSDALAQIAALGVELGRSQRGDDVTAQVVDVDARANAAQNSLNRLNDLFSHAGNVAELTSLEQQIAQREADRDSLLSQQSALKAQVSAATITANLVAAPPSAAATPPGLKKAHTPSVLKGLRGGWHAFAMAVTAIATMLAASLPFLGIGAVLIAIVLFPRRRATRAGATEDPQPQPEPGS